jgi:ABC-type glycerol-3-phosphate transport system permease component
MMGTPAAASRPRARHARRYLSRIGQVFFAALAVAFALGPILWAVLTSLKVPAEIAEYPPTLLPRTWTLDNYIGAVFANVHFLGYLWNTTLIVLVVIVLSLMVSAHAAYAVARFSFRGRDVLMLTMFSTIMIPGVAIVIPLYLLSVKVGLYDTIWVLILVYVAWLTPTLVWLLRGFIAGIPVDLEEAARIDGCSRIGAFYRITFPLLRSGLLAGIVLVFTNVWNEFLLGYSLVQSDDVRIIQVGIYSNLTEVGVEWGRLTAAAVAAIVPILVAYAFLQRSFIQGLSAGAVKG